jgi:hypothetical protein
MNNIRRFELISPFFPFAPLGWQISQKKFSVSIAI